MNQIAYFVLVAFFGWLTFWFNVFAALRGLFPYRETTHPITRRWIQEAMRFYIWLLGCSGNYSQEARLKEGSLGELRGCIVLANHPSMLDAPVLLAEIPQAICYYKASMHRGVFSNPGAHMAGYIRNDTGIDGVRQAIEHLRDGGNLILFPEGTRSPRHGLGPFLSGFALIAVQSKSPVVCLNINPHSDILSKTCPPWRCPRLPVHYLIEERLRTRAKPGERAHDFAKRIEAEYQPKEYVSTCANIE
ncbi:MAG: 1-acyl-sn-glycerol-3-phosphate acyltransferase [Opitutales bacterium]|nr:1-acyl-sn-glycerol-3-phosphate acyltransferase [Opitutales bacterium]